ncbi:ABC transporter permease subunit [Roseibium sp. RKSG952]|nr:ABC transporter permease subunit [Roseibium sp. RKSG952]MTH98223.1 ABC transporter permease subunit [Roseibium sp. RKSG952]
MSAPLVAVFFATTQPPGAHPANGLALLPGSAGLENYRDFLTTRAGFTGEITASRMLVNSLILGVGFAAVKVSLSLIAAYALAYFRVRGAGIIFWVLMLSLMLPLESRFLPTYAAASALGLVNTHAGLILPLAASGIGVLFFRGFLKSVPDTLTEAARLDGAGPIRFLTDMLVPLSVPMASALFLVTFVNGWNQYLWPVVVTSDESLYTLIRGLQFYGDRSLQGTMLALLGVIPPALLVILFQRQVVKGLFDGSH